MSSTAAAKSKRINLRASDKQENLLRRGAAERGQTLTDFIVESACREAEETLADQRVFLLDENRWSAFLKALDRPAEVHPRLQRLFEEPSAVESAASGSAAQPTKERIRSRKS
jgi:uncharacterized protein (DUF1778 family)